MPLYEYECFRCHHRFERLQRISAAPITECPACGGSVRRLLGVPALQFKGTGFYITDYGKGGTKPGGEDAPSTTSDGSPASGEKSATPAASSDSGGTPSAGSS